MTAPMIDAKSDPSAATTYEQVAEFDPLNKETHQGGVKPLTSEFWQKVEMLRQLLKGFWGAYVYGDEQKSLVRLTVPVWTKHDYSENNENIILLARQSASALMIAKFVACGLSIKENTAGCTAEWNNLHLDINFDYMAQDVSVTCAGHCERHPLGYCIGTDMDYRLGY